MSVSHYQTTRTANSNSYVFTTEAGHTYTIYFDYSSKVFPDEKLDEYAIYMGFTCVPKLEKYKDKYDPRVGETIMWIIANVFVKNKRALILYVCSSEDEYDRNRSIAFRRWYGESKLKDKFNHLTDKIGNTYVGALYNKRHPNADEIELALQQYDPGDKFGPSIVEEDVSIYNDDDDDGIFD